MKLDIDSVAALSRLYFSEEEKENMRVDMEEIIAFADRLREGSFPHSADEPYFPHGEENVLRADNSADSVQRELLLSSAKTESNGFITVPLVIDGGEG